MCSDIVQFILLKSSNKIGSEIMKKSLFGCVIIAISLMGISSVNVNDYRTLSDAEIAALWGAGSCTCVSACPNQSSCLDGGSDPCNAGNADENCGSIHVSGTAYTCKDGGSSSCSGNAECDKKQCNCGAGSGTSCSADSEATTVKHSDCVTT